MSIIHFLTASLNLGRLGIDLMLSGMEFQVVVAFHLKLVFYICSLGLCCYHGVVWSWINLVREVLWYLSPFKVP